MKQNEMIQIELLEENVGQIKGLSKNPRKINELQIDKLKKSIEESPEMLQYRTLLVYPNNGKYVILCGNMRYVACKELGYKEMPCYVLPEDTPVQKLKEFTVKDNIEYGQWDFDLIGETDWLDFFANNEFAIELLPNKLLDGDEEIDETMAETEIYDEEKLPPSLDYTLFFEDEQQRDKILDFFNGLEEKYPEIPTLAERLVAHIHDYQQSVAPSIDE